MTTANERPIGGRLRRLLVCFDGSPESKEAIELALDLGKALDAELTIFSVLADTSHLETTEARRAAEHSAGERLDAHLTGIRLRAARASVKLSEARVVGSDPAGAIADYAAEHGFDLVVIGSHGEDRITHGGLGRVVERLLRDPRFPILVAPENSGR
jgi:nucleotide-binding universal stress UspA family protein